MWNRIGGPSIAGSGWWGHLLNVEVEYLSISHAFIFAVFSEVASNGSCAGFPGGDRHSGHSQSGVSVALSYMAAQSDYTLKAAPTWGKL